VTLTVIDVGCATYGGDESIVPLIEEFHPDVLYGFDPQTQPGTWTQDGTVVHVQRAAVVLRRGPVGFQPSGLGGHVDPGGPLVPGIDLVKLVRNIQGDLILKLDCEMSEYQLLPALVGQGLDERIRLTLVEWHCPWCRHGEWSHSEMCEKPDDAVNTERVQIEGMWRGELREWAR